MSDTLLVSPRYVYREVAPSGMNEIHDHWPAVEERARRVASVGPQSLKGAVYDDYPIHQQETVSLLQLTLSSVAFLKSTSRD